MTKMSLGIVAAVVVASTAVATAVHAHGDRAGKTVTLTGEVIDLSCYLQDPTSAHGPDHAGCAKSCLAKGLPAALMVGKRLHLLLGRGHRPAPPELAALGGQRAVISGKLIERGGLRAVVVKKVRAAR